MLRCWQNDPDVRPTFQDLRDELKQMEYQHKVSLEENRLSLELSFHVFHILWLLITNRLIFFLV